MEQRSCCRTMLRAALTLLERCRRRRLRLPATRVLQLTQCRARLLCAYLCGACTLQPKSAIFSSSSRPTCGVLHTSKSCNKTGVRQPVHAHNGTTDMCDSGKHPTATRALAFSWCAAQGAAPTAPSDQPMCMQPTHQQVLRLDVPVDDVLGVAVAQRTRQRQHVPAVCAVLQQGHSRTQEVRRLCCWY